MKKTIILALVLMASASFSVAGNGPKKDKKKEVKTVVPVSLTTTSDSLGYAKGVSATQGLMSFVQENYHVDTAYTAEFIDGFKENISKANTPQNTARIAGMQIAQIVSERILPSEKETAASKNLTIDENKFIEGFIAAISKDTTLFNVESAKKYSNQVLASVDKKWLEENAKKPGVKVLPDGLQYKVITEGHGAIPKATDEVEVIYEGKTTDGKVFDATSKHGKKTDTFNAGNLIKGWTEALTMMPVGSKWEIYIPSELAYGEHRAGQIAPYSTLIFTLELVNIVEPQKKEEKKK